MVRGETLLISLIKGFSYYLWNVTKYPHYKCFIYNCGLTQSNFVQNNFILKNSYK